MPVCLQLNACAVRSRCFFAVNLLLYYYYTVSDEDLYAVSFAAELLCLRDQSYILTNDVVLNKDDLNDLLSVVLCE